MVHQSFLLLLLSQALLLASVASNAADDATSQLEHQEKIEDLRNTKVWATLMETVDEECHDLLDDSSFSLTNVEYMSSLPRSCLMSLSQSVASMMQEVVDKSLTEELMKFYQINQPDKINLAEHVEKLVEKYGKNTKKKKQLYHKLNKKYSGQISTALKKMLVLPSSSLEKDKEVEVEGVKVVEGSGKTKKTTTKKNQAELNLKDVFNGVQTPLDVRHIFFLKLYLLTFLNIVRLTSYFFLFFVLFFFFF